MYTGKSPFDMKHGVLAESVEATAIREKLSSGRLPGAIDDTVPPDLAQLLRQCWHAEPLLRPTAADVAAILLDISIAGIGQSTSTSTQAHVLETDVTVDSGTTICEHTSAADTSETSEFESKLLRRIHDARVRYVKAKEITDPPRSEKVALEEFRAFVDDNRSWEAAKYFLVGATILWNLVDGDLDSLTGTDAISTVSRSDQGEPKTAKPLDSTMKAYRSLSVSL